MQLQSCNLWAYLGCPCARSHSKELLFHFTIGFTLNNYLQTIKIFIMSSLRNQIMAAVAAIIAVVIIAFSAKVGEDVKAEQIVINQFPFSGKIVYWTQPGFQWQWWGTITTYDKTRQLWFSDQDGEGSDEVSDLALPIVFNDGGNGKISGSLRVKLPTDPKYLAKIRTDYPSMNNLMYDLIRPTTAKVIYASGPLLSAYESYAEKKNDLIFYITDQLNNGVYITRTTEVRIADEVSGEERVRRVASTVTDSLAPGGLARQERSPFGDYGLEISQLSISSIDYDAVVQAQIKSQQDANMSIQSGRVQALQAIQQAITAEEKGKAAAATAKWRQEEVKATEVTRAQQAYEVAQFAAKEADEKAKKTIAEGRAEAEIARLKVQAGLSPLERAQIDKETTDRKSVV